MYSISPPQLTIHQNLADERRKTPITTTFTRMRPVECHFLMIYTIDGKKLHNSGYKRVTFGMRVEAGTEDQCARLVFWAHGGVYDCWVRNGDCKIIRFKCA